MSKQLNLSKYQLSIPIKLITLSSNWSLETSLAPQGVILDLDNTDGVIGSTLEHVSCLLNFVFHDDILQNVINSSTTIATCNY